MAQATTEDPTGKEINTMSFVPDDLISIKEACKLIPGRRPGKRIHIASVYQWVHQGKLRAWRIGGSNGHLCVSRAEVLALLKPVNPRPEATGKDDCRLPDDIALARLRELGMRV